MSTLYVVQWFLRIALSASFLSAVADRFGMWGIPGAPSVAWGEWAAFVNYTAKLNWFLPAAIIPLLACIATLAEIGFAIALLIGWRLQWFALGSGLLLLSFALTMLISDGIKNPLDYSVFTAAGGALLLAVMSSKEQA